MKQKLDEIRTLAIKLYETAQDVKRKQGTAIWGTDCERSWRNLPSESVAVWDAVATRAYQQLKKHNRLAKVQR